MYISEPQKSGISSVSLLMNFMTFTATEISTNAILCLLSVELSFCKNDRFDFPLQGFYEVSSLFGRLENTKMSCCENSTGILLDRTGQGLSPALSFWLFELTFPQNYRLTSTINDVRQHILTSCRYVALNYRNFSLPLRFQGPKTLNFPAFFYFSILQFFPTRTNGLDSIFKKSF